MPAECPQIGRVHPNGQDGPWDEDTVRAKFGNMLLFYCNELFRLRSLSLVLCHNVRALQ